MSSICSRLICKSRGKRQKDSQSPSQAGPEKQVESEKKAPPSFSDSYRIGNTLGKGAYSVVKEGTHKESGNSFAIKIVQKKGLSWEDEAALKDEIQVLRKLNHVHIIRLYEVYEEPSHYYLVTEQMQGGELFDRIVKKSYYNEMEARGVCKILFEAMKYCHSKNIAHRDLKPENLLLMTKDNDSDIKIADFGFAKETTSSACLLTQCGTPNYVAPEILEGVPYGTKADMWSLGVITYILLGGYPPFMDKNQKALFSKIRLGQYEFHDRYWANVSTSAKDLISSLLTTDPFKRVSAEQVLDNPWMKRDATQLSRKDLGANLQELKNFNAKRKFRTTVYAVSTYC